jgi:hypothetical protein
VWFGKYSRYRQFGRKGCHHHLSWKWRQQVHAAMWCYKPEDPNHCTTMRTSKYYTPSWVLTFLCNDRWFPKLPCIEKENMGFISFVYKDPYVSIYVCLQSWNCKSAKSITTNLCMYFLFIHSFIVKFHRSSPGYKMRLSDIEPVTRNYNTCTLEYNK